MQWAPSPWTLAPQKGYCVLGPAVRRREGNSCLPLALSEGVGETNGDPWGREMLQGRGRSHSQTGNAPGASVLTLFFSSYPQPRADLVWKGVLPWVKKLLFTSRLLGVTGIPESSWGMGGSRGGNTWITRTILLVKPTPSLPSHSCPPLPHPLAPGSFPLEDCRGEQLVSEGLIRAQRPWLRARVRSLEDRLAAISLAPSSQAWTLRLQRGVFLPVVFLPVPWRAPPP